MYHLAKTATSYIDIKKSKFYGYLIPVNSFESVKEQLNILRKQYPDASHHCYGVVIDGNYRSNDDGEPAGTAGMPILETLKNHDLDNCLAVVVRYFGGTLLGASGLVKAYKQATEEAIKNAVLTIPQTVNVYTVIVDYALLSKVEYLLTNDNILNRQYGDKITYTFQSTTDLTEEIKAITNGKAIPVYVTSKIVELPVNQ